MTVLGITGGIGAGKSRVLEILKEDYKAHVIQADEVAKRLEEPGEPGFLKLLERFGTGILGPDGRLDKGRFADLIFRDAAALAEVNRIIHPLTWQAAAEEIRAAGAGLVAVEAALFDGCSREICGYLVFVDTGKEERIRRLMADRGYTREKCLDIMANQPGREDFLKLADYVIDNNGSRDQVRRQVARMLEEIGRREPGGKITDKKDQDG